MRGERRKGREGRGEKKRGYFLSLLLKYDRGCQERIRMLHKDGLEQ
jgi:hypothetical protein